MAVFCGTSENVRRAMNQARLRKFMRAEQRLVGDYCALLG